MAEAFAPTARMIADIQRQLASNTRLMQSIYESTRFVDRMMPQPVKPLELAATAEIARALSGSSALFTARVALAADLKLAETLKAIQIPAAQLSALTYASRAIASISEALLARTRFYADVDRAIAHVVAGWRVAVSLPRMQPPHRSRPPDRSRCQRHRSGPDRVTELLPVSGDRRSSEKT